MYLLTTPPGFTEQFPDMSAKRAQEIFTDYLDEIRRQLIQYQTHNNGTKISFSLYEADRRCGPFEYKSKPYSKWQTLHRLCPVITVVTKGNSVMGKVSQARISDEYLDLLIKTADVKTMIAPWLQAGDTNRTVWVPVDTVSMRHFKLAGESALETATGEYRSKIQRNLREIGQFQVIADYFGAAGEGTLLPHMPVMSPYGREYYSGLNLQNCSREVRTAALGDHFQVDLNAAAYAIKLMLAEAIYREAGADWSGAFTYTKEYLELKSGIRERLAEHIRHYPDGVRLVKQAITAIGFGARLQNSSWTDADGRHYGALGDIIRNPEDRMSFVNDPWVVQFCQEQAELTELITGYYLEDAAMMEEIANIPNMTTNTGRIRRNQLMCYLFQKYERMIMLSIAELAPPVLMIHDAAIYKQRPRMLEINTRLRQWSQYITADCEAVGGYRSDRYIEEIVDHKNFIQQEEQRVAELLDLPVHVPTKRWRAPVKAQVEGFYDGSVRPQYDRDLDPFYDEEESAE